METIQKTYQFILVLKNVDENTPGLEDSLYEAGCDDALINFRSGAVYLDFDRGAPSLEAAVLSAIREVESASIHPVVSHVAPEDLVTESEIANRLEMKRQAISLWIKGTRRAAFPKPVMKLSDKSPLWKWREIAEWLYANKIKPEKEWVINAEFIENMNLALETRHPRSKKYRESLLNQLNNHAS